MSLEGTAVAQMRFSVHIFEGVLYFYEQHYSETTSFEPLNKGSL